MKPRREFMDSLRDMLNAIEKIEHFPSSRLLPVSWKRQVHKMKDELPETSGGPNSGPL